MIELTEIYCDKSNSWSVIARVDGVLVAIVESNYEFEAMGLAAEMAMNYKKRGKA